MVLNLLIGFCKIDALKPVYNQQSVRSLYTIDHYGSRDIPWSYTNKILG